MSASCNLASDVPSAARTSPSGLARPTASRSAAGAIVDSKGNGHADSFAVGGVAGEILRPRRVHVVVLRDTDGDGSCYDQPARDRRTVWCVPRVLQSVDARQHLAA